MARKCARTFSIVVEKGKKSILDVTHLLPDALPRSVRAVGSAAIAARGVLQRCCSACGAAVVGETLAPCPKWWTSRRRSG